MTDDWWGRTGDGALVSSAREGESEAKSQLAEALKKLEWVTIGKNNAQEDADKERGVSGDLRRQLAAARFITIPKTCQTEIHPFPNGDVQLIWRDETGSEVSVSIPFSSAMRLRSLLSGWAAPSGDHA